MYGGRSVPHPSMALGQEILRGIIARIGEAGLLRMPVDDAVQTVHAATVGTTILLITNPAAPGMEQLSERTREAVLASILVVSEGPSELAEAARHLLVLLAGAGTDLTPGELGILRELLASLGR